MGRPKKTSARMGGEGVGLMRIDTERAGGVKAYADFRKTAANLGQIRSKSHYGCKNCCEIQNALHNGHCCVLHLDNCYGNSNNAPVRTSCLDGKIAHFGAEKSRF